MDELVRRPEGLPEEAAIATKSGIFRVPKAIARWWKHALNPSKSVCAEAVPIGHGPMQVRFSDTLARPFHRKR